MKHAFSLVELSIVLVILGLLTGGILAGQSLIRASELRAISTEYNRYYTAIQSFRDKYLSLPGDMANATSFWGVAAGTGSDATCFAFTSTTPATCNGNGNGQVPDDSSEQFRFWQHLANAGLIEGSYTGRNNGVDTDGHTIGSNCPASRMSNVGWATRYQTTAGIGQNSHTLIVGFGQAADIPSIAFLKPEEAWGIDTKLDDGAPMTGRVTSSLTPCTSAVAVTDAAATYTLTNSSTSCGILFNRAY